MSVMIAGIILAGGKGTRIKANGANKVTLPFLNKPMILYGVELMLKIAKPVVIVVGAFAESVKEVLKNYPVVYAYQRKRLGTAHATKVGLSVFKNISPTPSLVLVGYGDHTMFYRRPTIKRLISLHQKETAAMSLVTTIHKSPDILAWGRIIRDKAGLVVDSVEQKDATEQQKKIKELNAGFYCFNFQFLRKNINKVKKSPVSGEYYINNLIKIAADQEKKVIALKVPFSGVGIGINRYDELEESQRLYLARNESS